MSSLDTNKPFNNSVSEKQFNGFYIPSHNAKIIKESIENGTAPFLPDQAGNVNAKPVINGNTGYCLNAKDLIPLQIVGKDNSNIAVTYKTTQNIGTRVKVGEKGFFYNFKREDNTIGTSQFFFPEQTENPQLVKDAVNEKVAKNKLPQINKIIEIQSANPEEYLGTYVAACKSGASLKVNPEISEEFKKNFTAVLDNQLAKKPDRNAEIDTLSNFMFKVDQKANSINKELYAERRQEMQKTQQQSKKKEQTFEMGN